MMVKPLESATGRARPRIRAEFVLDAQGRPLRYGSDPAHYRIRLWVDGAPHDAHAVNWELHETYFDPVREVLRKPGFVEEITSYGDFVITARIRSRKRHEQASALLSEALASTYGAGATDEVRAAIGAIRGK